MNGKQAQAIEKEADNIPLQIGFKRLSENAVLPTKAHEQDSGFDVYAAEDIIVRPGATVVVKTDIAVVLPPYHEAYIKNRSGIASKTKLRVVSPPIDEGYRGAVGVIVDNIAINSLIESSPISKYVTLVDGQLYEPDDADGLIRYMSPYRRGTYLIRKGDRIAQLTVQPRPNVVSYEITEELTETDRGTNGWGSSGV